MSEEKPERDLVEKRGDYAEGVFRNTGLLATGQLLTVSFTG